MAFTILLVDDNPLQAATRQAILTYSGNKVFVAANAGQALNQLEGTELAKSVGLIITDHLMPGMNGPQFVTELRKRLPNVSVLVLSGMPDTEGEYAGMNVLYRLKPIAPEELIRLVQSLCRNALGRTA